MKKVIAIVLAVIVIAMCFTGCGGYNKQILDLNRNYNRAIIQLANGEVVEVEIDKWSDYEDGEQIQIIAKDGTVYLTSSFRCDLINDK